MASVSLTKAISLMTELKKLDKKYYNSGGQTLSDNAYDKKRERLAKWNVKLKDKSIAKYLDSVGAEPKTLSGADVELPIKMGSLDKIKTNQLRKIETWLRKMDKAHKERTPSKSSKYMTVMLSPKLDGVSLCIHYHKHKFKAAYSRSNGTIAQDLTKHMEPLLDSGMIPHKLPKLFGNSRTKDLFFTGELLLNVNKFKKKWERKNGDEKGFTAPRAAVSGYVNSSKNVNIKLGKDLTFICCNVKTLDGEFCRKQEIDTPIPILPNKFNSLGSARTAKFRTYLNTPQFSFNAIGENYDSKSFQKLLTHTLNSADLDFFPFETDGIVVELADIETRTIADEDNDKLRPKYAFAYKKSAEESDSMITKVTKIVWNTSKSGALIPTVEFDPVDINGYTISKASGSNIDKLERLGVTKGCTIKVVRSGDVIPEIISVKPGSGAKKLVLPKKCKCGAPTVRPTKMIKGEEVNLPNLYCSDMANCTELELTRLTNAVKKLGIDGLSKGRITTMYESGITDIFKLKKIKLKQLLKLDKFGDKLSTDIIEGIAKNTKSLDIATLMEISSVFIEPGFSLAKSRLEIISTTLKIGSKPKKFKKKDFSILNETPKVGKAASELFANNYSSFLKFQKRFIK